MRRHRLDPFSLLAGSAFMLIGAIFLLDRAGLSAASLRWAWPAPLILVGLLIIVSAARDRPAAPTDVGDARSPREDDGD